MNLTRKKYAPRYLFYLLVLAMLAGCAGKGAIKGGGADYYKVLDRWTRSAKVHKGLEARVYMSATYKSAEYREAYVRKYTESYQMGELYRKSLSDKESEEAERYTEFFFSAFTPDERWNDFDRKNSVWRLYLDDDRGNRLIPVSITKLDRSDPAIKVFFPDAGLWSECYLVRFPRYSDGTEPVPNAGTGSIKLTVTGLLGEGSLEWRLKAAADKK